MQILAVLAQKGGVGKSMVARSLAVQALIAGRKSAIIDADPQGTVVSWSRRREAPAPAVLAVGSRSIRDVLAELGDRGAEFVLIDTPPHAQPIIIMAAKEATATLIVTGPYPEDLEQVGVVAAIVQGLEKSSGILLNKTPGRAHAVALARGALATFRYPVCPTAITQLVAHPYASAEGLTAQEREPGSKAAIEVQHVYDWISRLVLVSKDAKIRVKRRA